MTVYSGAFTKNGKAEVLAISYEPAITLNHRLDLCNHSPDGIEWGYNGSGAAQCALAILAHHFAVHPEDIGLVPRERRERFMPANPKRRPQGLPGDAESDAAASAVHQDFKRHVIAHIPRGVSWRRTSAEITEYLTEIAGGALAAGAQRRADEG